MTEKSVLLSRPQDESLEAFKAWISEFVEHLIGPHESTFTEEEWLDAWQKFWSKADNS